MLKAESPDQELSSGNRRLGGLFPLATAAGERISQIERIIARNKWPSQAERALRQHPEVIKADAGNH